MCIVQFSITLIKHHYEANFWKKVYLGLQFQMVVSIMTGKHGSKQQAWWKKQEDEGFQALSREETESSHISTSKPYRQSLHKSSTNWGPNAGEYGEQISFKSPHSTPYSPQITNPKKYGNILDIDSLLLDSNFCISYFSIIMIKHHDRGNLCKNGFI